VSSEAIREQAELLAMRITQPLVTCNAHDAYRSVCSRAMVSNRFRSCL
jgi:hypothetical protein